MIASLGQGQERGLYTNVDSKDKYSVSPMSEGERESKGKCNGMTVVSMEILLNGF